MKGGSSGVIMFSGIFIVIVIIGVIVYSNSELDECKRSSDKLLDECNCNGPCSKGNYCNNKGGGLCETSPDLCYTEDGYKYDGEEHSGVQECEPSDGSIKRCKNTHQLNDDGTLCIDKVKCEDIYSDLVSSSENTRSVTGYEGDCNFHCESGYTGQNVENPCSEVNESGNSLLNPCIDAGTCVLHGDTISAKAGYFLDIDDKTDGTDGTVKICRDGIPGTSSTLGGLTQKWQCEPDNDNHFISCNDGNCETKPCNPDGSVKLFGKLYEDRISTNSHISTGNTNQDILQNCSISPNYCDFNRETLTANPLSEGQECVDNQPRCKGPDYLDDGEGGCIRNEACEQCGYGHVPEGYNDKFIIKGATLKETLDMNGFSDLLNDDLTTINSVKLDILKSQISCVEGGKCKITFSDGSEEIMDSEDESSRFQTGGYGLKQTGGLASNKLKINVGDPPQLPHSVEIMKSECYDQTKPNSPIGLGCIKGSEKEINFPNEDGNNYYYYDIQGQRKSLTDGSEQNLEILCESNGLTCKSNKSSLHTILGDLSRFWKFIQDKWECSIPLEDRKEIDGKKLCQPKNGCSTSDEEGNVINYCKDFNDVNEDPYFEGGTIDYQSDLSKSQEDPSGSGILGCRITETGPHCICKDGYSNDPFTKQCNLKDSCSPYGVKNPEWDDDEAELWLKNNKADVEIYDSNGKYKCPETNGENCRLYGDELLNFENGKYFNVYTKNQRIIQRCIWNGGENINPFIPCHYGSFIDTNITEDEASLGQTTSKRCITFNNNNCSNSGIDGRTHVGKYFKLFTPKCNIGGNGGEAQKNINVNRCCQPCQKSKKDNQETRESLEDFNKINRKINDSPIELSGKGYGYNTRPTFYKEGEETTGSLADNKLEQGVLPKDSLKVKHNLFTCLPTNKSDGWGDETDIDGDKYYSNVSNKFHRPNEHHGFQGWHFINEAGKSCANLSSTKTTDRARRDNWIKACNEGKKYKFDATGILLEMKCDPKVNVHENFFRNESSVTCKDGSPTVVPAYR